MKKMIAALLGLVLTVSLAAQDHLEFEGVPVDGPLKVCVKALRDAGFKPKTRAVDNHYLRGKYFGEEVQLFVGCTAQSQTAYLVLVSFPASPSWAALRGQYDYVKMRLTALYNTPSNVVETFQYPYTEEDGLRALEYGKCTFVTTWTLPEGEISLTLSSEDRVQVFFTDKANLALAASEKE